jgi:tetraacyldisaccharide 4'-kinase
VDAKHDHAAQVGDEPLLLARVAPTVVAHDRVAGAEFARAQGASIIVMDDGLQNSSLAKDFTLAVLDARRGSAMATYFRRSIARAADVQLQTDALLVAVKTGADDIVAQARVD